MTEKGGAVITKRQLRNDSGGAEEIYVKRKIKAEKQIHGEQTEIQR